MSIISFMSDPTAKRWRDMMRAIAAGVPSVRATEIARAALVATMQRYGLAPAVPPGGSALPQT